MNTSQVTNLSIASIRPLIPIGERLMEFALAVIRFAEGHTDTYSRQHISRQLIRSATSAGANYEEASGAQSTADFQHKLHIVLKELRESKYWLFLSQKLEKTESTNLNALIAEADALSKIIGKSISTSKGIAQP